MEHSKEVEKMIVKVMKKKDLARNGAIGYMLGVATGRLAALWRYDESVPEGKSNKGVLQLAGRKKRAAKTPKIVTIPKVEGVEKPAKPAKKRKRVKKAVASEESEQLEMASE